MNPKNHKYYKEIFFGLGLVAQLGLTMVVSILVMFFIGLLIDRHWELRGAAIVVFIFLGIIIGAMSSYRLLKKSEDKKHKS